ncbi:hypothetical protein B0H13DRAFT_2312136 [Mycena leptocephala]|nr:hypothetical protein B0H13DRAFT_2312136 [Mycena leptocephala]
MRRAARLAPTNLGFSPYGYTPTEYVCMLFVALFSFSTLLHIGQAIHYRMWWLFLSAILAGIFETVGWGGCLWSSKSPPISEAYEIQIVCTVMGVLSTVASCPNSTRFSSYTACTGYLPIDCAQLTIPHSQDIVSLVVQLLAAPTPDTRVSKDGRIQDEDEVPGMAVTVTSHAA